MKKLLALVILTAMAAIPASLPRKTPEYIIQMLDGKDQLLSKYRGKVVVIEFFSPTCPHCQKTVQTLQKLYKELGPKGFQPIAIAAGLDHKPLIPEFIQKYGLTFPVGFTDRDQAMPYLQIANIRDFLVPQLVFIDKQGMIREQHVGGDDLFKDEETNTRKKVLQLLTAAPVPPGKKTVAAAATKK